jgi:ribosome recycling factor
MDYDTIVLETEERMEKALDVLKEKLRGMRTGRASPGLVENIRVEYYGSPTPLKQIANISAPEADMIVIKPFDPSVLGDIDKAIQKSDIGIHPSSDGKLLRLKVPPLSRSGVRSSPASPRTRPRRRALRSGTSGATPTSMPTASQRRCRKTS